MTSATLITHPGSPGPDVTHNVLLQMNAPCAGGHA